MLIIENVNVYYGDIPALRNISMNIPSTGIIAVLGANGAGKTTLVRTISGIVKAKDGKISFFDQRIDGMSPDKIVKLGISQVPQGREIFIQLTVEENLRMGAYTRSNGLEVENDIDRVYEYFPALKARCYKKANILSGGEQQMLAIGRALMSKPKIMLLDEPSLGLAPKLVSFIFDIISTINLEEGIAMLMVEQNAKKALSVSQFAYVMEGGSISFSNDAEILLNDDSVRRAYFGVKES
jgi:branched-chain amino acid transport system ATP-binding protein